MDMNSRDMNSRDTGNGAEARGTSEPRGTGLRNNDGGTTGGPAADRLATDGLATESRSTNSLSTDSLATDRRTTGGRTSDAPTTDSPPADSRPDEAARGGGSDPASAVPAGEARDDHRLDPAQLPKFGQRLALRVLHSFGWTMRFRPLPGPRGIVVVYPHTSNWDFVVGLVAKWAMDLPFRWLAKDSMFRLPVLGSWFRWLGGQPVDRSAPQGMIRAQAERMNAAPWYWLVITPEGTRGYRPCWKSGFYHLALEARVPLVLVSLDYANKVLDFTQHLWLTGHQDDDMAAIRAAYAGRQGRHPKDAAPIELGERRKEPRG